MLKEASGEDITFLGSSILKEKVESITTLDYIEVPINVEEVVDVSFAQNRSILTWYTDNDNNGKYEMHIGKSGGIIANKNSTALFQNFVNVMSMDVSKFDTSKVTDMSYMFQWLNFKNLDLSSFDISKVTHYDSMFLTTYNIGKTVVANASNKDFIEERLKERNEIATIVLKET